MLVRSIAAVAALAFSANVAAEPMPYKPMNMKMSARELFGRQDNTPGYIPDQTACGTGNTCAEACGAGYETCASKDSQIHCFNPAAGEVCCPDKSGSSCEAGYYCTADAKGETFCCPHGMDLTACAAAYSITGGLVSQTPPAATSTSTSTTSTSTSTSTTAPATTTTTSTSTTKAATSTTTTEEEEEEETTTSAPSFLPSSSFVPSNTTSIATVKPPQPTATKIPEGAANVVGPASALVFLAAGLVALL
ncbi:hypothetical protein VTI74DRAFT_5323 [Chaetomium olivicolor]